MKIGLVCPYIYPGGRRRRAARPVPLREPAPERPRRPDHHREPRPAALVGGRHPAHRRRVLDADERLGRDADVLAALHQPGPAAARARAVRPAPLPRAVRAVPVAVPPARVDERQRRHVPRLRRLLAVVRAREPGDARARRAGSTAGSPSAPRPATSSTASSPATTRSSPTASTSPASPNAVPIARWQDGTPNVLFVGRHEPRKGLLDLLKAQRILRKTGYGTRLLVVGSGPQEREARRYVATRGLQGVEFLGRVSDAEKAQLFRTANVFASPATGGESFGIVLLEAMAAGAPDRRLGHPRLQGRGPARPRGAAGPAARPEGARDRHRAAARRSRACEIR